MERIGLYNITTTVSKKKPKLTEAEKGKKKEESSNTCANNTSINADMGWEADYARYLAEKEREEHKK